MLIFLIHKSRFVMGKENWFLFVCIFTSHSDITLTFAGEGLQILDFWGGGIFCCDTRVRSQPPPPLPNLVAFYIKQVELVTYSKQDLLGMKRNTENRITCDLYKWYLVMKY